MEAGEEVEVEWCCCKGLRGWLAEQEKMHHWRSPYHCPSQVRGTKPQSCRWVVVGEVELLSVPTHTL